MRDAGANWFTIIPAAVAAVAPAASHATVYMSVEQAQQAMFGGQKLVPHFRQLQPGQVAAIRKASGVSPSSRDLKAWKAQNGGWFILDRVIGKHEFITYAVALNPDGAVRRVEILEYRETYGGEIRNAAWRQQFVGKRFGAPVALGKDIKNISGATLSSRHITDGVRRLLATWQLLLRNG
jgi:Na+-translocating ferredoxin:NAD+ oxidoreductase RnfG subunit